MPVCLPCRFRCSLVEATKTFIGEHAYQAVSGGSVNLLFHANLSVEDATIFVAGKQVVNDNGPPFPVDAKLNLVDSLGTVLLGQQHPLKQLGLLRQHRQRAGEPTIPYIMI